MPFEEFEVSGCSLCSRMMVSAAAKVAVLIESTSAPYFVAPMVVCTFAV